MYLVQSMDTIFIEFYFSYFHTFCSYMTLLCINKKRSGVILKIFNVIAVIFIVRDIAVDSMKMIVGNKGHAVGAIGTAKLKTATLMVGLTLTLFYNLPFELIGLRVSDCVLIVSAVSLLEFKKEFGTRKFN